SNTKDLIEDTSFLTEEESSYRKQFIETINSNFYKSIHPVDEKVFSSTDKQIMKQIYETFGHLDQFNLSDESHNYPEWKKFEGYLNAKNASRFAMNYEDFFISKIGNENPLFDANEESLQLSKELFLENGYIYRWI
ncbi:MAG: type II toxin-antitoxin system antitoxin SocA domain-containing protein, partial [Bacteroidota bacterium]